MKKISIMLVSVLMALLLSVNAMAMGLPGLGDVFGVDMPNMEKALLKPADSTETLPDGSKRMTFSGITEDDYAAFSAYLSEFGCELGDYTFEGTLLTANMMKDGKYFIFAYDGAAGTACLTYPVGTNCEEFDLAAYEAEQAAASAAAAREAALAPYKTPGSIVTFGAYEQDNNTGNGKEAIEWLVLDYDAANNRALVISKYALDREMYNTRWIDITWEKCTLRSWLNSEFINVAFSSDEQKVIPTVTVSADKNPDYSTDPGNATQDKVFLLSITEVNKYFKNDEARMCAPTDYAIKNHVRTSSSYSVDGRATCYWWLRSPGGLSNYAAYLNDNGYVLTFGDQVFNMLRAVRPALYIDLNLIP